jgi:hypothetical protein
LKVTVTVSCVAGFRVHRCLRTQNQFSEIGFDRLLMRPKLGKSFIAHLEEEAMNTFVPSTFHGNPDTWHREWAWSLMTGIQKEYKI